MAGLGLQPQYYQKKEGRIGKRSPTAFLLETEKIEFKLRQTQKKSWKPLWPGFPERAKTENKLS